MKKKMLIAMLMLNFTAASLTGCGTSEEQGTVTEEEITEDTTEETAEASETTEEDGTEETQIANPWTDSDQQGILEATGLDMEAPEGASNVAYSYLEEDGMAQMTYVLDDADWTYRIQPATELTDISGIFVDWDYEGDATVSGLAAKDYSYGDMNTDNSDHYQMIQWYDAVTGFTYSLSAYSPHDLNGMDIQVYAEAIYQPLQGDATDDAAADRENELNEYFLGDFTSDYDGSTLSITANSDNTFTVKMSLFRAMDVEDTEATFDNHKIFFKSADSDAEGMIYRDSDNSLTVMVSTTGEGFYKFMKAE